MADKPKTVSLFDILATLPSGLPSARLLPEEFQTYWRSYVDTEHDKERSDRHALRDELYRDGGEKEMKKVIDTVFSDPDVKELRKKWVKYARFNNALKRIVNEISTVYAERAKRTVGKPDQQAKYQDLLDACRMDESALQWGRLANLHRSILVGFRVRMKPNGVREPVLDIITPANFRVVLHPNDDKLPVGYAIRTKFRTARATADAPAWTVWTDHESFQLRADGSVIGGTYLEHEFGVCPFVPLILGAPDAGVWPGSEGEDLVAAHIAIWMANVLLLKETKSATKQTIIQGDGTAMARGQGSDTEIAVEVADGQSVATVDMSMDLDLFKTTADHILAGAGANYGLSVGQLTHQGVQSAEARELMRVPLRELRLQQQSPMLRFERQLMLVMAAVCRVDLPEFAFDTEGWRIEFGEAQTPLSKKAMLELFVLLRESGLMSTVQMYLELHPGSTVEQAWAAIHDNIADETKRVGMMKDLMAMSGQLGANAPESEPTDIAAAQKKRGSPPGKKVDMRKIAREVLHAA